MCLNKKHQPVDTIPPHIFQMLKESPALAEAARYGIDIALLFDNMHQPVSQRIRRNQIALNTINKLRNGHWL